MVNCSRDWSRNRSNCAQIPNHLSITCELDHTAIAGVGSHCKQAHSQPREATMSTNERVSVTRREAVKGAAAGAVAAGLGVMTKEAIAQEAPYEAIVIGTGFGGGVAAMALHLNNKKTLVIERGTFWVTPETLGAPTAPSNAVIDFAKRNKMRVQYWPRPDHALGLIDLLSNRYREENPYGLHNYRMFRHAHILTASGVGGGSLIYSNVNLQAQPAVLDRIGLKGIDYNRAQKFMEKYRGKFNKVVTKIPLPAGVTLEQLSKKLDPAQASKDYLLLDRSRALRDASDLVAKQIGVAMPWTPLDLSVSEYMDGNNAATDPAGGSDTVHTFCERQGRCMLGCLPAARHTLNKTIYSKLLTDKTLGVTLQPLCEVRNIKPVAGGYEVTFLDHRNGGDEQTVTAPIVFLAAGTLGTTEILLRSQGTDGGL